MTGQALALVGLLLVPPPPCLPADGYTPTPTVQWDHDGADLAGFRICLDGTCQDLPCWLEDHDGDEVGDHAHCRGCVGGEPCGPDYPLQRFTDLECVWVDVVVYAYDSAGNESGPSSTLAVWLGAVWQPGEAYQ